MTKIPVGATIARAFHFVVHNFLNILGIMAIPMVVMWIPSLVMRPQMMAASAGMAAQDYSAVARLWAILLPLYAAGFVLMAMQFIGIAELALGTKKTPRWFYFSLGAPVWRLVGSVLFLILVIVLGWLAALLVNVVLGAALKALLGGSMAGWALALSGAIVLVGSVVIWCAYLYSLVRLGFLLIPVIAAREPGFGVARGWALGRGNFWRMFAILLINWLPLIVLEGVVIFGVMFNGAAFPPPHASAAQSAAFQAATQERVMRMMSGIYQYWYITLPVFVVVMVLFYGFGVGVQVFAYSALTSDEVAGS
jgi:hypothetical protein